ncbi:MAG: PQQ-binding-like beta-propeller repeat protein [Thermomicrobiales bacterium]
MSADVRIDRRALLAVTAAMGVAVGTGVVVRDAAGQEVNSAGATPVPAGSPVPPELVSSDTDWAVEGGNLSQTREAMGSTISASNVSTLGVAWAADIVVNSGYGSMSANPIIVGDLVYQQDMQSNVWALNKDTGEIVWKNEYNEGSTGPNGVAVGYGYAVFALGNSGNVVAVKADTGEEVWRTSIKGPLGEVMDMAPLIYGSTVIISTIPGNTDNFYRGGQRGVVHAIDVTNGNVLWYVDTTTDNLWNNPRVNSGGGLWHPPSVDKDGNFYMGVANAAPYPGLPGHPSSTSRMGDNDYANCLVKLNGQTAAIEWFINIKPHDLFDLDNHLSPILATISRNGVDTDVVYSSGKHGLVVCADAASGVEIWRTPVGKHSNDNLQELPDDEYVEVFPGTLGGVETPFAYAQGVILVPVYNMASYYNSTGMSAAGIDITKTTGNLVALDAGTGSTLWDIELPSGLLAGATVVNDLVFTGALDGVVRGFTIADGKQVFSWQAPAGLNAPFAISGDTLFVPAGGPLIPSKDTVAPEKPSMQLVALKLGASGAATPAS